MNTQKRGRTNAFTMKLLVALLTGMCFASAHRGECATTPPIMVSIVNKISTIPAASSAVVIAALVQNDPSNEGVTWTLTAKGVACSPKCGVLSAETATSVRYAPPSAVAATPDNVPTLTARSKKDATKSASDTFTITAPLPVSVSITKKIANLPADAAPVRFTAEVKNDPSNSGVRWTLMDAGVACAPVCGSLSGATATSVTYTAPIQQPINIYQNQPTLTAVAVKNMTKSDRDTFLIGPSLLTATITNKVNAVKAASGAITFKATVSNDWTNSGVQWSTLLGFDYNPCSPGCGTLGAITKTTAVYIPPAKAPAYPANVVNVLLNSARDTSKSDEFTFAITNGTVSSCEGSPTGHEALLDGQYAFLANANSAMVMAGSFAADGAGHFKDLGGGVAGSFDANSNGYPVSYAVAPSSKGPGYYTVGLDPTGVGEVGCLSLYGTDGSTRIFRFALGQVSGGIATAGRMTEYDDQIGGYSYGFPARVVGPLLRQDPTAFASGNTSHLHGNYAFGLSDGGGASAAGAFVLNPATGAIVDSDYDDDMYNYPGSFSQADVQGSTGAITSVSARTGRGVFTLNTMGWPSDTEPTQAAMYIVNADEFFLVSLDPPGLGFPLSSRTWYYFGRAIATASSFNASSLEGNAIYHGVGWGWQPIAGAASQPLVSLGLLNFNGGKLTGTMFGYSGSAGAVTTAIGNEDYTVSPKFGRVMLTGAGLTNPPAFYLATPSANTESIQAFMVGTDATFPLGLLEPGAKANLTTASMEGHYFFGDEWTGFDLNSADRAGVMVIGSGGALTGTQFSSAPYPSLLTESAVHGSIAITNAHGPGTGNAGPNSVAITNGTKLFFIQETKGSPASLTVVEHQ
jgi:hypothetical protein